MTINIPLSYRIQREFLERADAEAIRVSARETRRLGRKRTPFGIQLPQLGVAYERERQEDLSVRPDRFATDLRDVQRRAFFEPESLRELGYVSEKEKRLSAIARGFAPERPGPETEEMERRRVEEGTRRAQQVAQAVRQKPEAAEQLRRLAAMTPEERQQTIREGQITPSAQAREFLRRRLGREPTEGEIAEMIQLVPGEPLPPEQGGPGLPAGATPLGEDIGTLLRREREFFEPVTRPIGRAIGETIAVPGIQVPGEEQIVGGAEEVAVQTLVPSSLIPIPVLDPLLAKTLGMTLRGGALVTRAALGRIRGQAARVAVQTGDEALRQAAGQGMRQIDEALARPAEQALPEAVVSPPSPAAGVPEGAAAAIPPQQAAAPDIPAVVPEQAGLPEVARPGKETVDLLRRHGVKEEFVQNIQAEFDRQAALEHGAQQAAAPIPLSDVRTGQPFTATLYRGETSALRREERGTFMTPDRQVASDYAADVESIPLTADEQRMLASLLEKESERMSSGAGALLGSEGELLDELRFRSLSPARTKPGARVTFGNESFSNPIVFGSKKDVGPFLRESVERIRREAGEAGLDETMALKARSQGYDAIVYTKGEQGAGAVVDLRTTPPAAAPREGAPLGEAFRSGEEAITHARKVATEDVVPDALPPRMGGGALRPVEFSPLTERQINRATDTGVDEQLFAFASERAAERAPEVGRVRSVFNRARAVVDEALTRNPDVQASYLAATRYADAQVQRVNGIVLGFDKAVREAFGKDWLTAKPLAKKFMGQVSEAAQPYVGTVWHYLDNPELYRNASPLQRSFAQAWDEVTRGELRFGKKVGVQAGELQGAWVAHGFRNPERAATALSQRAPARMGKPGFFKKRRLDTEQFLGVAREHNLEVDTNVIDILARRLTGSARLRSNIVFLDEAAKKLGGQKLKPFQRTIPGQQTVQSGGQNWAFPSDIANDIQSVMLPRGFAPDEQLANQVVDVTRGTLLNLDFSVGGGRQGYLAFVSDPVGAIKSYGQAAQVLTSKDGWLQHYATNGPRYEQWSQHGLKFTTSPLDIETTIRGQPKQLMDRVPLVGQLNRLQFETIMPMQKLGRADTYLGVLQAVRDDRGLAGLAHRIPVVGSIVKRLGGNIGKMTDDQLMDMVSDGVNNWLGGIEWARIGRSPGVLRKLAILTEGWTRAQLGVILNAPKFSPKGILARRMLMQELALTASASTAISLALSGKLPSYDPRSVDFLDVVTPAGRISILPHKTLLRTAIRGLAGKPPDEFGAEGKFAQRFEAAFNFFEGRTGQLPRLAVDLVKGTDYFGNPIENKWLYSIREFMPIIVQGVWENVGQGRPPQDIAARAGAEFVGFAARPFRTSEQKASWLEENHPELGPYNPASIAQREAIEKEAPELLGKPSPEMQTYQREAGEIEAEGQRISQDVFAGTPDSPTAMKQYAEWRQDYFKQTSAIGDILFGDREPRNEMERTLQEYYEIEPGDFRESPTAEINWGRYEAKKESILRRLPSTEQRAVKERESSFQTSEVQKLERAYKALREGLDDYYELPREGFGSQRAIEQYRQTHPDVEAKLWLLGSVQTIQGRDTPRMIRILSQRHFGVPIEARQEGLEPLSPLPLVPLVPLEPIFGR